MACSIMKDMADKGFEVGTLHADNDATTQSRLPSTNTKKDDKSHVHLQFIKKVQTTEICKSYTIHCPMLHVHHF